MSVLSFEKWEGLGNDFLLVEQPVQAALVRALCDRRRGVGGDGVLIVERMDEQRGRMVVLNADGSRPEMCGNGLRCVAAYLVGDAAGEREAIVLTDAGERRCRVGGRSGRYQVEAEMGRARIVESFRHRDKSFVRVDVGNPHAVSFDPFEDEELDTLGPEIERATAGGINVELCRIDDGVVDVKVWERGVGRTDACGTGACAAVAAAARAGAVPENAPVRARLPGGELLVRVGSDGALFMSGPARYVYRGEAPLSDSK